MYIPCLSLEWHNTKNIWKLFFLSFLNCWTCASFSAFFFLHFAMAFLSEAKKKRTGGVVWKNVCCVHVHPQLLFFPTHLHCPEPWPWTHHTASAAAKGAALLDNIKGEKVRKCRSVHRLSAWLSRLAAALHFSSQSVLWRTCEESTWHFTSEPPGLRAPDTHRLLFRGFFFLLNKVSQTSTKSHKTRVKKVSAGWESNQPFSPSSPCTDRSHPGPGTISERICLARTYPTLSFLGNAVVSRTDTQEVTGSGRAWSGCFVVVVVGFLERVVSPLERRKSPGWTPVAPAAVEGELRADWSAEFVTRSYLCCGSSCMQPRAGICNHHCPAAGTLTSQNRGKAEEKIGNLNRKFGNTLASH